MVFEAVYSIATRAKVLLQVASKKYSLKLREELDKNNKREQRLNLKYINLLIIVFNLIIDYMPCY